MGGTALRHIAVVANDSFADAPEPAAAVLGAVRAAAARAGEAFAAVPTLRAFSFVSPAIDRLLAGAASAPAAVQGCLEAATILEAAAARCHAALRLCGRLDGLPQGLARLAAPRPPAPAGRSIFWFLRYGGRDEIVRASARFLRERPGATLGDDDLDGLLDTAGAPDPDLIVLAGGPLEAPDALVWQGSYAELWHTPRDWAACGAAELGEAIADFRKRQRRFGG